MGLLSLFKQKQETSEDTDSGEFRSRSEEESAAARSGKKRKPAQNARKDKTDDPVLPEKKRARRRLIGALALVLAAVIGLPMLLDSEPKPLPDDISIQIPSKDKPLPASAAVAAHSAGVASDEQKLRSLDAAEEIIVTPATDAKSAIVPALTKLPAVKNNITTPPAPVAPKKESVSTPKQEQKAPVTQAKTDSHTETKVAAPVAGKATQKTPHPEVRSGSADAAKNQADTSDEASRALSILEGKAPAKAAGKPDVTEKTEKTASHFVVQVAALASQDKVSELQAKLNAGGVKSYTQKVATTSGEKIRVRLGPFSSKEDAEKAREKLVKLGLSGTLVPN